MEDKEDKESRGRWKDKEMEIEWWNKDKNKRRRIRGRWKKDKEGMREVGKHGDEEDRKVKQRKVKG